MENEVTNTQTPQTPPAPQPAAQQPKSKTGLIIISLTGAVLVIAGVFAWYTSTSVKPATTGAPTASNSGQSTSASLEDEVNNIDIKSNDSDFTDIDKDLQAL